MVFVSIREHASTSRDKKFALQAASSLDPVYMEWGSSGVGFFCFVSPRA